MDEGHLLLWITMGLDEDWFLARVFFGLTVGSIRDIISRDEI